MVVPPWQVFNGVWGRVAVGSSVLNWNFPSLRWKLDGLQCLISEAFILNSRLERQYSVINLCIKKKNSISAYYVNYLCVISASRAPTLCWVSRIQDEPSHCEASGGPQSGCPFTVSSGQTSVTTLLPLCPHTRTYIPSSCIYLRLVCSITQVVANKMELVIILNVVYLWNQWCFFSSISKMNVNC